MGVPVRIDRTARAVECCQQFITDATVKVLAEVRGVGSADDIRKEIIGKGAVSPTKTGDYPSDAVIRFVSLSPSSTIAQLATLATRIDLTGVSVSIPLPGNWAAASFIPEGSPIPVRQGAFSAMPLDPVRKLALMTAWSSELETATGGAAAVIMERLLEDVIRRGADGALLSANAATDDAPAGLLFGVTPIAGSASMSADLAALAEEIAAAGIDTNSIALVCAPGQAMSLSLLAGPKFNHQIIESSSLEAGTVVAVATGGLIFAGEGSPEVSLSKQALLHMADPAAQIAPPGGPINAPVVSTFQADLIALRCVSRITSGQAPGIGREFDGSELVMTDEERKAAFAKARERAGLMLDEGTCRTVVEAEFAARTSVKSSGSYFEEKTSDQKVGGYSERTGAQRVTSFPDAVESRLMAEIDRRIAAAVDAVMAEIERTMSEHRASSIEWIKASSEVIVREQKLRAEHELRISALLAEVEKMQRGIDAKVIDLPKFIGKRDARS